MRASRAGRNSRLLRTVEKARAGAEQRQDRDGIGAVIVPVAQLQDHAAVDIQLPCGNFLQDLSGLAGIDELQFAGGDPDARGLAVVPANRALVIINRQYLPAWQFPDSAGRWKVVSAWVWQPAASHAGCIPGSTIP